MADEVPFVQQLMSPAVLHSIWGSKHYIVQLEHRHSHRLNVKNL